MQVSIGCNNMMTFYKMVVTIEISHATACFLYNQGSRRIIPLTDKRFGPCIKTTISYIQIAAAAEPFMRMPPTTP